MAHAYVKGVKHQVRVTQDLTDNYGIELWPEPPPGAEKRSEPYKPWPTPLLIKVRADSRAHALVAALEHLKTLGRIDTFHLEPAELPPPPAPPAPKPPPAGPTG